MLAVAIALWLIFSVSLGDILVYLGYEAVFVAAPGILAYMALAGIALDKENRSSRRRSGSEEPTQPP